MPSDSIEKRRAAASNPPSNLNEPLPCPRCDSSTTKFCYYNNYNLCQPRYFCKSCRRYWTHGGALRNVPIGGGYRKSTKRTRPRHATTSPPNGASSSSCPMTTTPEADTAAVTSETVTEPETDMGHVNLNEGLDLGSFTYSQGHGYLTLGGYGLDPFWVCSGGEFLAGGGVGGAPGCNSWQAPGDVNGGSGGFVDGDGFAWPDLAISSYGKSMK